MNLVMDLVWLCSPPITLVDGLVNGLVDGLVEAT